jgi:hypothetical protein
LVLVDELAFLTAYQPERDLHKRGRHRGADQPGPVGGGVRSRRAARPTQGRDQLANLFSTRIALRPDESDHVEHHDARFPPFPAFRRVSLTRRRPR